ncbi:MAG: FkbM family methyltransferase [Candidatus Acidiferrales bacterium]
MLPTYFDPAFIRQVGPAKWATRFGAIQFRKWILRTDTEMRLPTGGRFRLFRASRNATEVYVTRANIDWGSEQLFASFGNCGTDFLDIGAHIGYYSVYLSPLVRRAYAFEPDPRNLEALRFNAQSAGNISVYDVAISSREGAATLVAGGDSSTSYLGDAPGGANSWAVRTTTVDAFVSALPGINVALVKTDVEGHDLEVLRGMTQTVRKFQPLILSEIGSQPGPLLDICKTWDYEVFAFTRDRRTFRTCLKQMVERDLAVEWFKMLFLVPGRLHGRFLDALR